MEAVTDSMEKAASTADLSTARRGLQHSMETLRESLTAPADGCRDKGMKTKQTTRQHEQGEKTDNIPYQD